MKQNLKHKAWGKYSQNKSMEELEAFELELKMLGYEDDGDWAVGIDPQNRPWRHSPRDDEDPGAAGSSKTHMNQNTQVYMMMGGGVHHHHHPKTTKIRRPRTKTSIYILGSSGET